MTPKNSLNKILSTFLTWRLKHIGHRQFIYLLSFIVGLLASLSAILLKKAVFYTHEILTFKLNIEKINFLYLAFPLLGTLLTILFIKYFVKDKISHGISRILYAISKKNSSINPHNCFTSIVASTFTVGFGGSVGLEAPIVLTGSSLGSNLGRLMRLNYKSLTILIGCGAAGAIGGIFNAPIAAVIFALEVLMLDLTMWSIIPLLIASVTGATVSSLLTGKGAIFSFAMEDFPLKNILYYIVLGLFTGLISVVFTKGNIFIEALFKKINNPFSKLIIGGSLLGVLILIIPPLYGEGYDTLDALLNGNVYDITQHSFFYQYKDQFWVFIIFLFMILFFKIIAMSVTLGSGGIGGIFAPTLFMGGISGYLASRILNLFDFIKVSERNFALVGMAGVMAGVMHAPLTAIFLIAEISGGYLLFIPLMVTATISYITAKYFEPHSIYTIQLAKRGELITHHKDKAILTLLNMGKIIETDFNKINPEASLEDLVKIISKSKRNIFPVVNNTNMLVGIVLLDNIRHIIFNSDMYKTSYVKDLMILPPTFVSSNESMESVMKKFEENDVWNLPVIDNGKYIGFLSKSKIFSVYRKWLMDISEE